jgi:hypothetical protein
VARVQQLDPYDEVDAAAAQGAPQLAVVREGWGEREIERDDIIVFVQL